MWEESSMISRNYLKKLGFLFLLSSLVFLGWACSKTYTLSPTPPIPPAATSTHTPNYTPSQTASFTWTQTGVPTSTNTPTHTPVLNTATPTTTQIPTHTMTDTFTNTPTITSTFTPTITATITSTFTAVLTNTCTSTQTMTNTPTKTLGNIFTPTCTASPTETLTPTMTITTTQTPTNTPTITSTNLGGFTSTITLSPTQTMTVTTTNTCTITSTQTTTNTPTITLSPTNTFTPNATFQSCSQLTLGDTNQESTLEDFGYGFGGGVMNLTRYQPTTDMTLYTMSVYIGSSPGNYQLAVYSDRGSGNGPANILGQTSTQSVSIIGWSTAPLLNSIPISHSQYYWLGVLTNLDFAETDTLTFTYTTTYSMGLVSFGNLPANLSSLTATDGFIVSVYASGCPIYPTATYSPTPTLTPTLTETITYTATNLDGYTSTITDTPTITLTPTITDTPTFSLTPSLTNTPTQTSTYTLTPTPTTPPVSGDIITIAGNGTSGYTGDGGLATAAKINTAAIAIDQSGNIFFADDTYYHVREVTTSGIITTVAGNGTAGDYGNNGPATLAELKTPFGVSVDSSENIYIVDESDNVIRKVNATGIITTVAGTGVTGYTGDGVPATSTNLYFPWGVAADSLGDFFIVDAGNERIRKVNGSGIISTVAGNGTLGSLGDGGPATLAELNFAQGIAVDAAGDFYIIDQGNTRIRKVDTTGTITTVAGNGSMAYSGDGGPATLAGCNPYGIAVDSSGNLFISDANNNRIRKVDTTGTITTVAGNGTGGFSGDDGPATSAKLQYPFGIAVDSQGNIFFSDAANNRIREVLH